jgi:hypothetical protein
VSEHLKTRMFIGMAGFCFSHRISGGYWKKFRPIPCQRCLNCSRVSIYRFGSMRWHPELEKWFSADLRNVVDAAFSTSR